MAASGLNIEKVNMKRAFVLCLALGVVSIIATQFVGMHWLSVVLSVAVMCVYILLGHLNESAKSIQHEFADTIYYMGFLFTLIALIVSLYEFRDADTINTSNLITNFSLALITTCLGLAARIVINNFSEDSSQHRRRAMSELDKATDILARETQSVGMKIEQMITEASGGIQGALKKTQDEMVASTIEFSKRMKEVSIPQDVFVKQIGQAVDSFTDHLAASKDLLHDITVEQKGVQDSIKSVADGINRTAKRFDKLEKTIDKFSTGLEKDALSLKKLSDVSISAEKLSESLNSITDQISNQAENSQQVNESISNVLKGIKQFPGELDSTTTHLKRASEVLQTVVHTMEKEVALSGPAMNNMKDISVFLDRAKSGFSALTSITDQFTSLEVAFDKFYDAISYQTDSITTLGTYSSEQIELIRQHQEELAQVLSGSREATSAINQHFTEAVKYITRRLE